MAKNPFSHPLYVILFLLVLIVCRHYLLMSMTHK